MFRLHTPIHVPQLRKHHAPSLGHHHIGRKAEAALVASAVMLTVAVGIVAAPRVPGVIEALSSQAPAITHSLPREWQYEAPAVKYESMYGADVRTTRVDAMYHKPASRRY